MTAFARRPEALEGARGASRIVKGDAQDEEGLRNFSRGQDAIIVILNPPNLSEPTTLQSEAATYLGRAAESGGAKRIVWTSSTGLDATRPQPIVPIAKWFLRHLYADLGRAERILMESGVDWTLARSVGLSNKPPSGRVRFSFGARQTPSGPYWFSRGDLAAALVELVTDPRASRAIVSINRERGHGRAHSSLVAHGTSFQ
jgi:uncharacterized protein YbjT (DUF2867 family)